MTTPPVKDFWSLVAELEAARQRGRVTLLEAIQQVYPAEKAVEAVLAKESSLSSQPTPLQSDEVFEAGFGADMEAETRVQKFLAPARRKLRPAVARETLDFRPSSDSLTLLDQGLALLSAGQHRKQKGSSAQHGPSAPGATWGAPGRFFWLTYSNTGPLEERKLFQSRDGIAFGELSASLIPLGYHYGTTIHLYPNDERRLDEFPTFHAGDLLVLTTRPPLTDSEAFPIPKKSIQRANNDLEKLIFKQLSNYFTTCTRRKVTLTPKAQARLRGDVSKWQSLEFFEHSGGTHPYDPACIRKHVTSAQTPQGKHPSTVAFLLRLNSLPGLPFGLLVSFAMDGYSTLIWNHIVRVRHPEWLAKPGFVMAELIFKKPIPRQPPTPEFAADPTYVEVKVLTKA
jgi:hypothetical protein